MATEPPSSTTCCDAKIQQKPNVEPSCNKTSLFLGNHAQMFPETLLRAHENSTEVSGATHRFQEEDAANEISWAPFGPSRSTRLFLFSEHHKYKKQGLENALIQSKEEELTTRLSPSSLSPVSFKWEIINGHTPMMFATMCTR